MVLAAQTGEFSECSRLTHAALHFPGPALHALPRPRDALHDEPIDHGRLFAEFASLKKTLEGAGVAVAEIGVTAGEATMPAALNLMYLRDVAVVTPFGLVLSRMGSDIRGEEPNIFGRAVGRQGWPILGRIEPPGRLEGADVLWLAADRAVVAVGNRSNEEGARQLQALLAGADVHWTLTPAPRGALHLLGALQIVDRNLAIVRQEIVAPALAATLRGAGYRLVQVSESQLAQEPHAMNVVALRPGHVLARSGCPAMAKIFADAGVAVVLSEADELIRGGGGFGCAVGVLRREGGAGPRRDARIFGLQDSEAPLRANPSMDAAR